MSKLFVNTIAPNSGDTVTLSGSLTTTGKLTIGDATSDTVSFEAEISSSLIPDADNTYDLGSATNEWKDLYIDGRANIDELYCPTIRLENALDAKSGSTDHPLQIGFTNSDNVIFDNNEIMARNNGALSTLHLNPDGGDITINNNISDKVIINSGSITVSGYLSSSTSSFGIVSSSVIPAQNMSFDLGKYQTNEWESLFVRGISSSAGTASIDKLIITDDLSFYTTASLTISNCTDFESISGSGVVSASDFSATGDVTLGDDLTVGDDASIGGLLNVTGLISGISSSVSASTISGILNVGSVANTTVGGVLLSSSIMNGISSSVSSSEVNGVLTVTGTSMLMGVTTASGAITAGTASMTQLNLTHNQDHASVDASHMATAGKKFTVKNQLQASISDGATSPLFTVANTHISGGYSTVVGNLSTAGGLLGGLSMSKMIINVTANNSMSFAFNNESGAAVADDQGFTASFTLL